MRFEGNKALSDEELGQAAPLPGRILGLGAPEATPELLDALEARLKDLYLSRGYPEVKLRRQLEHSNGRAVLVFQIQEGRQRLLRWLRLELPPGGFGDPLEPGRCLPLIFSDKALPLRLGPGRTLSPATAGPWPASGGPWTARGRDGPLVLTFTPDQPIPLLRADLARVFNALQQQGLPALGVVRPVVRLTLEAAGDGTGVRIQVPDQPVEKVRRLVVTGSDKTRARAVLRETQLEPRTTPGHRTAVPRPGPPELPGRLPAGGPHQPGAGAGSAPGRTCGGRQARAGGGVASPRRACEAGPGPRRGPAVALEGGGSPAQAWRSGRPTWSPNSFGYDRSQGYYVGAGLQQLNVGGMGRTIDYAIRAGNGTIQNPTLAKWFPTGPYNRSVDSFTVGYTDPWFAPGSLESLLHGPHPVPHGGRLHPGGSSRSTTCTGGASPTPCSGA